MERARELGFSESFLHEFYEKLYGGLVTVVMARLKNPPDFNILGKRIRQLWQRQSLLHHHIEEADSGRFYFVGSGEEHIPVTAISDLPATQLFDHLLQSVFHSQEALWSIHYTCNPHPHILLKIHHAIADGSAARALLCELMAGTSDDFPAISKQSMIHPSVEELMSKSRRSIQEPLPPQEAYPSWKFNKKVELQDRICHTELFEMDGESVIHSAHQNKISVNAFFMAAALRASKVLKSFPDRTSMILPVSVRHLVEPPLCEDEMGCYIGNALVHSPESSDEMEFNDLARNLDEQLHQSMQTSITAPDTFKITDLDASIQPYLDPGQGAFGYNIALSNLGIQHQEIDNIDALWFGASVRPGHVGIIISINTIGTTFCVGLNFAEPLIAHEEIINYRNMLIQALMLH